MSASINPTRAPCLTRAHARFTATVDFPTPALLLLIAMVCLTVGIRLSLFSAGPVPAAPAGLTSPIHFPSIQLPHRYTVDVACQGTIKLGFYFWRRGSRTGQREFTMIV